MKKLFVIFIIIISAMMLIGSVQAQPKMDIGVKTGLNFASVSGDIDNSDGISTVGGGAFIRITDIPQISFQAELLFIKKGFKAEIFGDQPMKLTYLEMPVLILYKPPLVGKIKPSVYVGPSISFMLQAKHGDNSSITGGAGLEFFTFDYIDYFNRFDLGIVFGSMTEYAVLKKMKIFLDGRYTMGLLDLEKLYDDVTYKSRVFSISAGVIFSLELN